MRSKYLTNKQRTLISVIVKVIIGLLFISPLFIGLIFSFVPDEELLKHPTLQTIRNTASFNNYKLLAQSIPVFSYLKTTLIDCLLVITVQILLLL